MTLALLAHTQMKKVWSNAKAALKDTLVLIPKPLLCLVLQALISQKSTEILA